MTRAPTARTTQVDMRCLSCLIVSSVMAPALRSRRVQTVSLSALPLASITNRLLSDTLAVTRGCRRGSRLPRHLSLNPR